MKEVQSYEGFLLDPGKQDTHIRTFLWLQRIAAAYNISSMRMVPESA